MTEKKEVAKQEEKSKEVAAPQAEQRGIDGSVSQGDYILPRIELLQALSPAVGSGQGIPGQLVSNITKEDLGKPTLIPIQVKKSFICWRPREAGGGIEYRTDDPNDPRVQEDIKWNGDQKPKCTQYLNFLCLQADSLEPIVVSFCKTSYQAGKKFLTLCRGSKGDIWVTKYELSAVQKTNNYGTFYVLEINPVGPTTDTEMQTAEALYHQFHQANVQFDSEGDTTIKDDWAE